MANISSVFLVYIYLIGVDATAVHTAGGRDRETRLPRRKGAANANRQSSQGQRLPSERTRQTRSCEGTACSAPCECSLTGVVGSLPLANNASNSSRGSLCTGNSRTQWIILDDIKLFLPRTSYLYGRKRLEILGERAERIPRRSVAITCYSYVRLQVVRLLTNTVNNFSRERPIINVSIIWKSNLHIICVFGRSVAKIIAW